MHFFKIEHFAYGKNNERSFSNPHPWWTDALHHDCDMGMIGNINMCLVFSFWTNLPNNNIVRLTLTRYSAHLEIQFRILFLSLVWWKAVSVSNHIDIFQWICSCIFISVWYNHLCLLNIYFSLNQVFCTFIFHKCIHSTFEPKYYAHYNIKIQSYQHRESHDKNNTATGSYHFPCKWPFTPRTVPLTAFIVRSDNRRV